MRLANFVVILCAGLAIASPVVKRALHTKVVTTVVYEYVTVTALPLGLPSATTTMSTSSSVLAKPTPTSESPPSHFATTAVAAVSVSPATSESSSPATESPLLLLTIAIPMSPSSHVTTLAPVSQPPTTKVPPPAPTTEAPPAAALSATSKPLPAVVPVASPVVAVSATSGLSPGTDYSSALVYHHNIHRRNHSSPDAAWDANLASYAAQVAESCKYGHDTSPGGGGYGQNIAAASYPGRPGYNATYLGISAITDLFYDSEFGNFLPSYYGQPGPAPGITGWDHFTQILWAASTSIGCATTLCDAGKIFTYPTWYTVCNYSPQGNVAGAYGANVGTPRGHNSEQVI